MDYDTLYGGLRWNIIERIAQTTKSPLELAKELNTSIANISMHLRVMEAASIVTKQRISNSKAGEPRILYALSKEILYLSYASSDLQVKNQFELTSERKALMQIWQLPAEVQGPITVFYFSTPFPVQYNLYFESIVDEKIKLTICTDQKERKITTHSIMYQGKTYSVELTHISLYELNTTTLRLIYRGIKSQL